MFKKIFSEKRIFINNLSDKPISELIKDLQKLQDQGYEYLSVQECYGGYIKPYSFRSLEDKNETKQNLQTLINQVNEFKIRLNRLC